jgi:adenosylcobinamide-GDP ribazoletransferase
MPLRPGSLRAALELLTRLPVPAARDFHVQDLVDGAAWYPAIGLGVGALLWGAGVGLNALGVPLPAAVVLVVLVGVVATGALHEDGLADAADGLFGGWTPARRMEIMRDSRLGTYGGVALFGALALRAAGLFALPIEHWAFALVGVHALARWGGLVLLSTHRYARQSDPQSVAAQVVDGVGWRHLLAGTGFVVPLAVWQPLLTGVVVAAMVPVGAVWVVLCRRKVGGMTGDLVGGGILLFELAGLVTLATWLG